MSVRRDNEGPCTAGKQEWQMLGMNHGGKRPHTFQQAERDNTGNRYVQTMETRGGSVFFFSFLFVPSLLEEEIAGLLFTTFKGQSPIKRKRKRSGRIGLKHRQGSSSQFRHGQSLVRFGHGKRLSTTQQLA